MEQKTSSDKRFALLIDADNVSAKYLKPMLNELSKYGTVTIKRIYGDWTLTLHAKWKDALLENSITPIQQFGYTQGKNATDSAMIIDAMDILYTDKVEGFCIVSSDSDFTRLASRLRESGRMVIGMGEKKTPTPFRRACDVFTTLELLIDQNKRDKNGGAPSMSKEEVEQAVVDIVTDNQNNGKATGLGEVGSRLLKRYPDFDVRSYGTNLLSKLLSEFTRIKITRDHSSVTVELADSEGRGADAKEKGERKGSKAAKAKDAKRSTEKDSEAAEESDLSQTEPQAGADAASANADAAAEEGAAAPAASDAETTADGAGEEQQEKSRRKPRRSHRASARSRRRAQSDGAQQDADEADATSAEDAPEQNAEAVAAHAEESVSHVAADADAEAPEAQAEPSGEATVSGTAPAPNVKPAEEQCETARDAADDTADTPASSEAADEEQADAATDEAAAGKAKSRSSRRRRSRRQKAAEPHDAQEGAADASEPAPEGSQEAGQQRKQNGKQAANAKKKQAPENEQSAATSQSSGQGAGSKPAEAPADTQDAEPKPKARRRGGARKEAVRADAGNTPENAAAGDTPQRCVYELVAEAGAAGVPLASIGQTLRARFKNFKVRDLGYPQLRTYVANAGDFVLEKDGRDFIVKLAE